MAAGIFLPVGFRWNQEDCLGAKILKEIRGLALSGGLTELQFYLSFLLKPFLNCVLPLSLLEKRV